MAITREAFYKGKFTTKAEANNRKNHPIYKFLLANSKKAFTTKEIRKAVKLSDAGVRGMLRILKKMGLIEHKSPYFIAKTNGKKRR